MGIDLVEMVMEIEDEFKLSIADEDYEHLPTVGDMYEYVLRKKGDLIDQPGEPHVCLTMVTFALLRPALVSIADVSRRSIRTMTSLHDILPPVNRRADWEQLQFATGLKLPPLQRPPWMVCALAASAAGIALSSIWLLSTVMPLLVAAILVPILIVPILAKCLGLLSREYAIEFPDSCGNVGGFSRAVLSLNYGTLQQKYYGWGNGDVWGTLRGIISEQLGIPIDEINYDSRFIEDLGAD